jgi:arylsulfatase A-like enzyme
MKKNVAQSLRYMGYATGMVGKWGMHSEADSADYNFPYSEQTSLVKSSGFDFVDGLYIQNQNTCTYAICSQFSHNMEWITESALRFMDSAMKNHQPFFLYFAATLPHHPPESSDALTGLFNSSQTPAGVLQQPPDVSRYCSSCTLASREAIWDASIVASNAERRHELAALIWVDESLGVVYDFLSERGAIDNTFVVMSTDHGPVKGSLYEQGTRVPLYVVGPGIAANTLVTDLVSHVDMAPTFLEWAGCTAESCPLPGTGYMRDGLSWAPLVSGKMQHLDREEIYMEAMLDVAVVNKDSMKFLRRQTPDIKTLLTDAGDVMSVDDRLINLTSFSGAYPSCDAPEQVYDLIGDSLEQVNLVSAIARARLGGIDKYWDRIRAHEAKTFALTREQDV